MVRRRRLGIAANGMADKSPVDIAAGSMLCIAG
jgi:hypothetical protein